MNDPELLNDSEALAWLFAQTRSKLERDPERTRAILRAIGDPQQHFRGIHIVGTNGKGSVCAMIAHGLSAQGHRIGRFTSPHLVEYRERITVNAEEIPQRRITRFIHDVRTSGLNGAFFELSTALAFQYFAEQGIELAVVEAGVGGANDATMCLEHVELVVITNVSLDHVPTLGTDIAQIAREKAGAIRTDTPVITGATGEALEIIQSEAALKNAPLYTLESLEPIFDLPHPPRMPGAIAHSNARLAAAGLHLLGHPEAVEHALETHWPGRFETLKLGEQTVILDGAHNPAGAMELAQMLKPGFSLIFGAFSRKNVQKTLEPLAHLASALHFVAPPGEAAADPQTLARAFGGIAHEHLEQAISTTLEQQGYTVITGSLHLVGLARQWLIQHGWNVMTY